MANSKHPFLITSIIIFFFLSVHAQNLNIYLCPLTHAEITKSMVCVSKADGTSLFEYVLTEDDIENGSEYHIDVPDPAHYCLSIINEYQIDTINEGRPFHWAKTYFDMAGDLHLYAFDHPKIEKWYPEYMVVLSLHNMPIIEHWEQPTNATFSNFKQTGSEVWAQANIRPGEDLFVIMKALNDPRYRYIYIPATNMTLYSNEAHAIDLDWKNLKSDLTPLTINLPFETEFLGTICSDNIKSGNKCMFYSKDIPESSKKYPENYKTRFPSPPKLPSEPGKLKIFVPSQPLANYYARVWWGNSRGIKYEYRIHHGNEFKFPLYDEDYFLPEDFKHDTSEVEVKMKSYPDGFRIFFNKSNSDEYGKVGMRLSQTFRSTWIVIGKNKRDINFELPAISENNKNNFTGFSYWYYDHLENVKFVNEEANPDWINFFHDYNVLLVSYRDPFK